MTREQHVRDALARFLSALRRDTDAHLQTLSAELIQVLRGEDSSPAGAAGRLVAGIRRIDDATTLRGVLDALAAAAAEHVRPSSVLLIERAAVRPYRQDGYAAERAPGETTVTGAADVARAIAAQAAVLVRSGDDPQAPPFLRVPDGSVGLLMPIVVAGQVVAMVHGEGDRRHDTDANLPEWAALVESLARHAAAKLENVTSKRTAEALGAH
jgi:hypothetical protein